jgi:hypothetical protein
MSCSSWFSPDDFDHYSVLKTVLWSVPPEECPAGDCCAIEKKFPDSGTVQKKTSFPDSETVKKKTSGMSFRNSMVPKATETRSGRVREPHSSSRIGMDKLLVRASADAPYDLDVAAVDRTGNACGSWFTPRTDDLRRESEPADHADALASDEDQFEAKLHMYRRFTKK